MWRDFVASQGKYDEAMSFHELIMDLDEHVRGVPRAKQVSSLVWIVRLMIDTGKLDEAAALLEAVRPELPPAEWVRGKLGYVILFHHSTDAALAPPEISPRARSLWRECLKMTDFMPAGYRPGSAAGLAEAIRAAARPTPRHCHCCAKQSRGAVRTT